jgi:chromosome segregation ATPase
MKKLIALMFSAVLLATTVASPTFASEKYDYDKALELIEKTNQEIDEEIEKAVEKADELQAKYLLELREIEEGKEVVKLKRERAEAKAEFVLTRDIKKKEKLKEKLAKIEKELKEEKAKIDKKLAELTAEMKEPTGQLMMAKSNEKDDTKKIEKKIAKLTEKLAKKSAISAEKSAKYTEELQKVISDVYNETLEMSAKTLEKAEELGVRAECTWKLVRFADQWVWIDPLRVIGIK